MRPSPPLASHEAIVAASTFLPEGAPEAVNRWAKITGGAGTKTASVVRETADGGIVYDGETNAYGAAGTDFLLFKVDSSGSPVWANRYGTANDDGGAAQPTDDGGYIVAGWTMTPPATSSSWLMKLDASGAISWQKDIALAVPMGQTVLGVSKILSDGYLLTGIGIDFQSFSIATILIKTDLSGNIVWQKNYSLPGYSLQVQSVLRLTDGSLMLGGMATNSSTMDSDLCVVKLTATGDLVWANTYGGPAQEVGGTGLILTTDNGFILQGETKSWGMGGTVDGLGDIWFVKLDSSGNIQWQYAYGGAGDELGVITVDPAGGYFLGATTTSFGAGKEDLWAVKLNATGQITWQKTYGGAEDDYGAVLFDPSGSGYLLSATTLSFGAGGRDEWMAKLDASGNIVWQNTYGTGLEEEGAGYRATSGDILIQGHSKLPSPPTPTVRTPGSPTLNSVGELGTSCPFIRPGLGVMGTGAGVATASTATPVSAPVIVGVATFTTSPGVGHSHRHHAAPHGPLLRRAGLHPVLHRHGARHGYHHERRILREHGHGEQLHGHAQPSTGISGTARPIRRRRIPATPMPPRGTTAGRWPCRWTACPAPRAGPSTSRAEAEPPSWPSAPVAERPERTSAWTSRSPTRVRRSSRPSPRISPTMLPCWHPRE